MASAGYVKPTVEDCSDSDDNGVRLDPAAPPSAPSPPTTASQANVHTKRSNPSDLRADKAPQLRPVDQQSDSGYSSHTAATMSSADSAPSATSQRSIPNARPPPGPSRSPSTRNANANANAHVRPDHHRHSSSHSSQRQPSERPPHPSRRLSVNTRPTQTRRDSRVSDLRAEECPPAPPTLRRSRNSHSESVPDAPAPRDRERELRERDRQRRESVTYRATPSPVQYRSPHQYHGQGAIIEPAQSRRRPSLAVPQRPLSYHGNSGPTWAHKPMPHQSPQLEHGPPPSRSAYSPYGHPQMHPPHPPFMQQQQPPNPYYNQVQPMPPHPQYDPRRHEAYYGPRNPALPAIVTQALPSARGTLSASQARPPPFPPAQPVQPVHQPDYDDESGSETDSDYYSEEEEEPPRRIAARPPPPPQPPRPSLPHSKTTPAHVDRPVRRMPQTVVVAEPRERERRGSQRTASRPPHIKSNSYDTHNARVIVESSRNPRRDSRLTYDRSYEERPRPIPKEYIAEQKRHHRSSKYLDEPVISDYEEDQDQDRIPRVLSRSRRDTDSRRRPERPVEVKNRKMEAAAESYQNAHRGVSETYADQSYRAAKRGSRISGSPSEAESSRSRGSDKQSQHGGNGEIRLKVDANAPVSLFLNGDLEGRRLQLMPADDSGMAELVISGGNGQEKSYISDRSSRDGRRAIMPSQPRRDAEEFSEKSSRSGRPRRDTHTRDSRDERERRHHVLRRHN